MWYIIIRRIIKDNLHSYNGYLFKKILKNLNRFSINCIYIVKIILKGSIFMFCNSCGNQIKDNSRFCRFCGMPVLFNLEKTEAKITDLYSYVFCIKCGEKIKLEKGYEYCNNCGCPIQRTEENRCRICNKNLEKGSLFCSNCGAVQ